MAKKIMTLEEKLEEAIVKDVPYEIPQNWIWTNVGSISLEIKNGTTIKQNKDESGIKVTRIESLQNNGIDLNRLGTIIKTDKIKEQDYYVDGDIALSHINSLEHVGKTALIDNSLLPLVHGMNLLRIRVNKNLIIPKYFQLYTRGYDYKKFVVDRVNRAVNQVSLNQKNLSDVPMPIPPLKEQQRIVNRIESLFENLDKAKELIEDARDDFAKRKSAILAKAFRGEFTKSWRKNSEKENAHELITSINRKIEELKKKNLLKSSQVIKLDNEGELYSLPKSWRWVSLSNICRKITDGAHNTPKKMEEGFRYITAQHVKWNYIDFDSSFYISEEDHRELYNKCTPECGDILVVNIGAGSGISAIVNVDYEFSFKNIAILKLFKEINSKYIYYFLLHDRERIIKEITRGGAQPFLSLKILQGLSIPLCSIEEQNEIVRILDKLLKEESKVEELTQLEEQIELIKKSILAKAFRGQLGTNCEEDESALELLKKILNT